MFNLNFNYILRIYYNTIECMDLLDLQIEVTDEGCQHLDAKSEHEKGVIGE